MAVTLASRSLWMFAAATVFGATLAAQVAPAGAGRDAGAEPPSAEDVAARRTFEQVCSTCHEAERAFDMPRNKDDWQGVLDQMAAIGTTATDEQWTQVLDYLLRNHAKVDVNRAPAAEIAPVLGVTPEVADAIVKQRTASGPFKTLDDVARVPGVDAKKLTARKDRITF
jgi:competence protein ComEA